MLTCTDVCFVFFNIVPLFFCRLCGFLVIIVSFDFLLLVLVCFFDRSIDCTILYLTLFYSPPPKAAWRVIKQWKQERWGSIFRLINVLNKSQFVRTTSCLWFWFHPIQLIIKKTTRKCNISTHTRRIHSSLSLSPRQRLWQPWCWWRRRRQRRRLQLRFWVHSILFSCYENKTIYYSRATMFECHHIVTNKLADWLSVWQIN